MWRRLQIVCSRHEETYFTCLPQYILMLVVHLVLMCEVKDVLCGELTERITNNTDQCVTTYTYFLGASSAIERQTTEQLGGDWTVVKKKWRSY